ncbi:MAG: hypothetical protein JSS83_02570 [Cyanobacteria bacterium SZAS LIN-3]|nr:hypothetical protein [Cyanobacteria bacterium SZAS LIN-3]
MPSENNAVLESMNLSRLKSTRFSILLLCLFVIYPASGVASEQPRRLPIRHDWLQIANADLVAKGRLNAPIKTIKAMRSSKKWDYIDLRVTILEIAKGIGRENQLKVRYFVGPAGESPYSPTLLDLTRLNGKEITLLLTQVEGPSDCSGYYFLDRSASGLRAFDRGDFVSVKKEVAQQKEIVKHFQECSVALKEDKDRGVRLLLDQLTNAGTQESAWKKLLKLPRSSVPALIRTMDDERPLANSHVELPNPPTFFESVAHYGPETVFDAVSILLSDKTMSGVRSVSSHGYDKERRISLEAWRIWAYYKLSKHS